MGKIEARMAELGIALPDAPAPLAQYVPAKVVGDLAMTSGQIPMRDGRLLHTGTLSADLTVEQGRQCARQCTLNALAALKGVLDDLERIAEVVSLHGYVSSAAGFSQQPQVMNGASELLVEIFGDAGRHVRSAIGVCALPLDAPVELELVVRVRS